MSTALTYHGGPGNTSSQWIRAGTGQGNMTVVRGHTVGDVQTYPPLTLPYFTEGIPAVGVDLSNTCDGTNSVYIDTSNSTGPDQFNYVSSSYFATAFGMYDTAHYHSGSTSLKMAIISTLGYNWEARWTGFSSDYPRYYTRAYVYLESYFSVTEPIITFRTATTSSKANLAITSTGALQIRGPSNELFGTSTAVIPLNQWVRVEMDITDGHDNACAMAASLYTSADSSTPTETVATTTGTVTTTPVGEVDFGFCAAISTASTMWMDDLGVSTSPLGAADIGTPPSETTFSGWGVSA